VLFCIIDSGLDASHPDLSHATTGGCAEGSGPCRAWDQDLRGHGTHVAGTIAAARNGQGVVGVVAEGARLWMVNLMGTQETFPESDFVPAWDACLAELERLQASVNRDMKMVGASCSAVAGAGCCTPGRNFRASKGAEQGRALARRPRSASCARPGA
jgi:hypothetical protein